MNEKIKIGISSCLLGENVRYDGGHKRDRYLTDILGKYVQWVPVCPEVEYGLPIPREAMRLTGNPDMPHLVTRKTGVEHTEGMLKWAEKRMPSMKGQGIFAHAFLRHFPLIPVEDEGRLNDAKLRENLIERIFVFQRWKSFIKAGSRVKDLISLHTEHKLLLMSHSQKHYTLLGRLVADTKKQEKEKFLHDYISQLMEGLKLIATVKKNTNVLMHIMGYFKKNLSSDEKAEILEIIDNYHMGLIPLVVPVTLLNHYVRKFDVSYLKRQHYLNPHPVELMLRNHV
jgi:uncharacterized protein YbgA (DUF1722 family)/uncharacterized protein YbbK (DUF523 family)